MRFICIIRTVVVNVVSIQSATFRNPTNFHAALSFAIHTFFSRFVLKRTCILRIFRYVYFKGKGRVHTTQSDWISRFPISPISQNQTLQAGGIAFEVFDGVSTTDVAIPSPETTETERKTNELGKEKRRKILKGIWVRPKTTSANTLYDLAQRYMLWPMGYKVEPGKPICK